MTAALPRPGRLDDWAGRTVVVAGTGVAGFAMARVLVELGARVVAHDDRTDDAAEQRAERVRQLGATVQLGALGQPGDDTAVGSALAAPGAVVVASPGIPPTGALPSAAIAYGLPVWGDAELAWRLRGPGAAEWLVVTGTNGKTTTVGMLAAILRAAGTSATAAGNIGTPLVEVVTGPDRYDFLAVELSSFQLYGATTPAPLAAVVLNLAPDHVDWHGSYEAYARAKARAYDRCVRAALVPRDPAVLAVRAQAQPGPECRDVGLTSEIPAPGSLGLVEDLLVDRAFVDDPATTAEELAGLGDLFSPAPHVVADALAAAGLARAAGVAAPAVADGLRGFRPSPHRIALVATVDDVDYVDDSKATNPHAAAASLAAYAKVVWIAGGLAKGAEFDDLVEGAGARLRAVVLLGRDRAIIRAALRRHAPDVPVVEVDSTDTVAMEDVVRAAARSASPGDTVLLAPACASWDMFASYGERGDLFVAAVARLRARTADGRSGAEAGR